MILLSITPDCYGPFSKPTKLELDETVTALTGANDVGKSFVLRAIREFCQRTKATEDAVNVDRLHEVAGSWDAHSGVKITAEILIEKSDVDSQSIRGAAKPGDRLEVEFAPNQPSQGHRVLTHKSGNSIQSPAKVQIKRPPTIISVGHGENVGDVIDLGEPNSTEKKLLALAFGPKFTAESHHKLNEVTRHQTIARAERQLNLKLRQIISGHYELQFKLHDLGTEGTRLGVTLIDNHEGYVSINRRGSGIRRIVTLLVDLLESRISGSRILLLDEPENSLHADAQHKLRGVLEALAAEPGTQVVYATHSPAMINPTRPETVRVLTRSKDGDFACTRVQNSPFGDNFQRVRTSLGLVPSDSLLYGSITLIVEGDTEVRCLDPLLQKLSDAKIEGFELWPKLVSECHFVGGEGDKIPKLLRVAKSQNANPIVFLDGDKSRLAQTLAEQHPDVPVVLLEGDQEFEDLVPLQHYLNGVTAVLGDRLEGNALNVAQLSNWLESQQHADRWLTSKRVARWVECEFDLSYSKHEAMEKAIESSPPGEIVTEKMRELVARIASALEMA